MKKLREIEDKMNKSQAEQNNQDEVKERICRYFNKGTCRHGYHGKNEVNGVKACKYAHPRVCKRWIDHGASRQGQQGCMEGRDCQYFHPIICKYSLKDRTCPNIPDKETKCKMGYHLKNTKFKIIEAEGQAKLTGNKRSQNKRETKTFVKAIEEQGDSQTKFPFHQEVVKIQDMQAQLLTMMRELKGIQTLNPKPPDLSQKIGLLDQEMSIEEVIKRWG